jgi:hypothetical protein
VLISPLYLSTGIYVYHYVCVLSQYPLYMCTTICVSSVSIRYICVPLYVCPQSVSAIYLYHYICVLTLSASRYACATSSFSTAIYVYHCICVLSSVSIRYTFVPLYVCHQSVSAMCLYHCMFVPLHVCTTINASSYSAPAYSLLKQQTVRA